MSEWENKWNNAKTVGEGKQIGRDFRDKFKLTDMEAINYLNGKCKKYI